MAASNFIILLSFHIALWWVALSRARLVFLPFKKDHPAPLYFAFAILLQSLHAFILSFNPLFYFEQRFYNTLAVILIIIASHLFFLFGDALFKTATEVDGKSVEPNEIRNTRFETIFFIFALFSTLLLEYFLGGNTNNLLTPGSIDVMKDSYLVSSRFVTFGFVVFCEWSLIRFIYRLFSTTYGNRITVKLRGWAGILSTTFISLHYVINPIATFIIFVGQDEFFLGSLVKDFYVTFEAYNVIPIAFFLLIATSPRRLVNLLASFYLRVFYSIRSKKINFLRDLLVKNFPEINLGLSASTQKELSSRSKLTRLIVEISDGINLLLKYISAEETRAIISRGQEAKENPYQIEAEIIYRALINKKSGSLQTSIQVAEIASLKAVSLPELAQCYYMISERLARLMKERESS